MSVEEMNTVATTKKKDQDIPRKKSETECQICLRRLKDPKFLSCMHTFCQECIQQLVKNEADSQEIITCPTCQQITKDIRSLRTNFIIQNMIRKLEDPNPELPNCGECAGTKAVQFCYECRLALCEKCANHHLMVKRFARHRVEDIKKVTADKIRKQHQYCTTHNELLKYFCKQCSILVCHDCMVSKLHSKHERGLVDEVLQEKQEEINDLMRKGKENKKVLDQFYTKAYEYLGEAEEQRKKGIKEIEDVFDAVIDDLKERKKVLLQKVCDPYEKSEDALGTTWMKGQNLKNTLEYGNKLLRSENKENLEALGGLALQLQKCITESKVEEQPEKPQPTPTIRQSYSGLSSGTDARGNAYRIGNDGRCYYQDPTTAQWYLMLLDGVYYHDTESTHWFQFLSKRLLTDAKVGDIAVNIKRVDVISNKNINYKNININNI